MSESLINSSALVGYEAPVVLDAEGNVVPPSTVANTAVKEVAVEVVPEAPQA